MSDKSPNLLNPDDFIITRKRKKYRFALFNNSSLCYEVEQWQEKKRKCNVLEIGAGTGLFSVGLADLDKNSEFVAVDVKADRLQNGARKAEELKLTNINFLRARVDQLIDIIPKNSLNSIWLTFPDPYPKNCHDKNRLTHRRYLKIYHDLLRKGGTLYFKTDASELFKWSLEEFVKEGWIIQELSFDLHDSVLSEAYRIKTTYESRYMKEGKKINFVKAVPPIV